MAVTHDKDDYDRAPRFGHEPRPERRDSVSAALRRAREAHGQDLRTVAQVLRIRQAYLEALEAGEFDRLPGTTYALGFLRTYAEFLGLDGHEIVDRFKEEVQGAERRTELIFPEPVTEGRIPGGAIILISVVLLGLAYGGWFYLSNQGRTVADLIPALPEQLQALLETGGDAASKVARAPSGQAPSSPTQAKAEGPAPEPSATRAAAAEKPRAVEPAPTAAAQTPPASAPERIQTGAAAPAQTQADPPAVSAEPEPDSPMSAPAPAGPVETPAEVAQAPAAQVERTQVAALPAASAPETGPAATDAFETPGAAAAPDIQAPAGLDRPVATSPVPLVEQTVVIPAPPAAPQSFEIPTDRSPRVYGENNENARIVLRALQDSWVQVRDGQDALLLTRVLRTGDVYYVPDQEGLTLLTGNAGGIEIEVDGVKLAPLGPVGSVRRQITLDPAQLLSANAAPR
ncbi:MAG: RodZ domain-containing protein [Kiloniellaceae bacterium]